MLPNTKQVSIPLMNLATATRTTTEPKLIGKILRQQKSNRTNKRRYGMYVVSINNMVRRFISCGRTTTTKYRNKQQQSMIPKQNTKNHANIAKDV